MAKEATMLSPMQSAVVERYRRALTEYMGLPTAVAEDGDVLVDASNLTIVVTNPVQSDPDYLRMFAGMRLPPEIDVQIVDAIAASLTLKRKAVKVRRSDDAVIVSVEMFVAGARLLPTLEHLAAILPRVIETIAGAVYELIDLIKLEVAWNQEAGTVDNDE